MLTLTAINLELAPVARAVLILSVVVALGLAVGSIRFKGIGLGIAGVLFAGLLFGHLGMGLDAPRGIGHEVLEFAREFGLILFVYTIGLQVGPGFLASLRRQGLPLNLLAGAVVLLGAGLTVGVVYLGKVELPVAVGLFSGATTNTPSLAAAQQALKNVPLAEGASVENLSKLPGLGYAVAYPFGILGIILVMLLVRMAFRVQVGKEAAALQQALAGDRPRLGRANLEVSNPNLEGLALGEVPLPGGERSGVVFSRILQGGELGVPMPETRLHVGDVLLAVGPAEELVKLRVIIGKESQTDLRSLRSDITTRRIIVTQKRALGKTVGELDFVRRYGVTLTRVSRVEIEFAPTPGFAFQYGDTVLAVGEAAGIAKVAAELGDSPKRLDHPEVVPIFVGIALGVLLGSWPLYLPGLSAPVKLGLAGGPLLVAIVLSRVGRIGPLVWYMPLSANYMLRELGIALFLACVGLNAGDKFVETLTGGDGLYWMALAAGITLAPLGVVALVARLALKLNYLHLCGLLAGSMTDPPALAFAHAVTESESPAVAYATVYPLTMILRVLCAQVLVVALWG